MAVYLSLKEIWRLRGRFLLISLVIALITLLVLFVGDNPAMFRRYRQQTIVLDSAHTDEAALRDALERMLGAKVHRVAVTNLDLVNDSTTVDVRYQLTDSVPSHESLGVGR